MLPSRDAQLRPAFCFSSLVILIHQLPTTIAIDISPRSPIERSSDRFFLFDGVIPWFLGSLDIFKSDLEEEEKKKAERGARRRCCRSAHRAQPASTPLDIHRIDVDEPFI